MIKHQQHLPGIHQTEDDDNDKDPDVLRSNLYAPDVDQCGVDIQVCL